MVKSRSSAAQEKAERVGSFEEKPPPKVEDDSAGKEVTQRKPLLHHQPSPLLFFVLHSIRIVAGWTFALLMILGLWALLPFQLFNPLLRRLGVRNRNLPMYMGCQLYARCCTLIAGITVETEGSFEGEGVLVSNHSSQIGKSSISSLRIDSFSFSLPLSHLL